MLILDAPHPASPSVFISSTVKEFRDLRSAIAYTLRAQGVTVFLSEAADFDVRGDRSAIEECFANIRASDYYILLIGSTRGNLYEEGTSITRKEYRVARNQFLCSGRPRLFFYLREAAGIALRGYQEVQKAAGIDYPDHLNSFIDEVERPQIDGAPNYLTRFHDFEDLIHSVTSRLNLGRTLSETLTRHSLASELLSNLTLMMERAGTTAVPRHRYMSRIREGISITEQDLCQRIVLSDDQVISLVFALPGRTRGKDLRTKAIEESLDRGVFLTFNAANGTVEESPLHKALRHTSEDIQTLCRLDTPNAAPDWDSKILTDIKARWRGHPDLFKVMGHDLAYTLAHYDRVENVFSGHLALCKVLLGMSEELQSYQRQPTTPLGNLMEQQISAERVSAGEITFLIQNSIWPFGPRVPREIFGTTRKEQVQKIADKMHTILTNAGIDVDLHQGILKNAAEKFLDEHTALPEEGIEDLRPR